MSQMQFPLDFTFHCITRSRNCRHIAESTTEFAHQSRIVESSCQHRAAHEEGVAPRSGGLLGTNLGFAYCPLFYASETGTRQEDVTFATRQYRFMMERPQMVTWNPMASFPERYVSRVTINSIGSHMPELYNIPPYDEHELSCMVEDFRRAIQPEHTLQYYFDMPSSPFNTFDGLRPGCLSKTADDLSRDLRYYIERSNARPVEGPAHVCHSSRTPYSRLCSLDHGSNDSIPWTTSGRKVLHKCTLCGCASKSALEFFRFVACFEGCGYLVLRFGPEWYRGEYMYVCTPCRKTKNPCSRVDKFRIVSRCPGQVCDTYQRHSAGMPDPCWNRTLREGTDEVAIPAIIKKKHHDPSADLFNGPFDGRTSDPVHDCCEGVYYREGNLHRQCDFVMVYEPKNTSIKSARKAMVCC